MKLKTTFDKINEGLTLIRSKGGSVQIDGRQGRVSISGVKARFAFDAENDILTVVIDDKPWLASNSMIEEKIKEFFS